MSPAGPIRLFNLCAHTEGKESKASFKDQEECRVTTRHPGGQKAFH